MAANGHIELLAGVLRVGQEFGQHGDPYEWSAAVRWLSPTEVELMGLSSRPPKPSEWRAIGQICKRAGIETVRFCRRRYGVEDEHVLVRRTGRRVKTRIHGR